MKFSVIIPCHNAAPWIGDTLKSVAAQTHAPHEIIVVNDASTDDSAARIRAAGVEVRLLEVNCRNASAARNRGIDAAGGDWIALLDADDVWYPHHLAFAAALLEEGTDVAYVSLRDKSYLNGRKTYVTNRWPIQQPTGGLSHNECLKLWSIYSFWCTSVTVGRRERIRAIGGFDESQGGGQDLDFWLRLIHGQTWAYCPEATACGLRTQGSVSRSNAVRQRYFTLQAWVKNRRFYGTALDPWIQKSSRRALFLAYRDPQNPYSPAVRDLAPSFLSPIERSVLKVGRIYPAAWRFAWRMKRRLKHRPRLH